MDMLEQVQCPVPAAISWWWLLPFSVFAASSLYCSWSLIRLARVAAGVRSSCRSVEVVTPGACDDAE